MKTCPHCHELKPVAKFYADKAKKDGLSSWCKKCCRIQAQDWAQQHPDARRRIMRDWAARTDQQKHNRKTWVKRAYDLTPDDLERMMTAQNGECAVCGKTLKKYHIDHDHTTGVVRGLLCRGCNLGLGFFRDSVGRLAAAIQYLEVER